MPEKARSIHIAIVSARLTLLERFKHTQTYEFDFKIRTHTKPFDSGTGEPSLTASAVKSVNILRIKIEVHVLITKFNYKIVSSTLSTSTSRISASLPALSRVD